jgi:hypothetical protein
MSTDDKSSINQRDILRLLCDEQWSNAACCGYLIIACETLGYSHEKADLLLNAMKNAFNQHSVEQAKSKYIKY